MKTKAKNKAKSIDQRVAALMKKMTPEETFAQLSSAFINNLVEMNDTDGLVYNAKKLEAQCPHGLGRITAMSHFSPAKDHIRLYNTMQKHFIESTRLGIPFLTDCEALHGCVAPGSTSYPQAIALAASWNVELMEAISTAIGKESRQRGNHQVLSPVLDLATDPRCGRTEETYGEDPHLASRMAVAYVKGVQSQQVACTPKHFAANFVADGGRDSFPIHMSERILREVHLRPYEAVIKEANALGIMTAYHSLNGSPCSANRWLLTDILRGEWGFRGATTSDWGAVNQVHDYHHTAHDYAECALQCLEAGLDIEQPFTLAYKAVPDLVAAGRLSMEVVNEAVRRLLYVKFWAGLFDNPYFDESIAVRASNTKEQRQLAHSAASQGAVLLKNDADTLPVDFRAVRSVALIGPHCDEPERQKGGYSTSGAKIVTLRAALEKRYGKSLTIHHCKGSEILEPIRGGVTRAATLAKQSDLVLLCLGGGTGLTEGEGSDRTTLRLPEAQETLLNKVVSANPNTVVLLTGGKPVEMKDWIGRVPAVLMTWYLSQEGGPALVDLLSGKANPSGKLPVTFPVETGQCPYPYLTKPSGRKYDYINLRGAQEQYAFGHGLSYTTFSYEGLQVKKSGSGRSVRYTLSFTLKNTGTRKGAEVVQLYLRDETSKLSRPLKELKGFQRIELKPRESKRVQFRLTWDDLAYLGHDMKPTLEPGNLIFMIGASSTDIRLRHETQPRNEQIIDTYHASEVLPPQLHQSWGSVAWPDLSALTWSDVPMYGAGYFSCTFLTEHHHGEHGLVYLKATVHAPKGGTGKLAYGADAAVKVWLNGEPISVECFAAEPLQPEEYVIPVTWQKGENQLIFAISTNHGNSWGVTANALF